MEGVVVLDDGPHRDGREVGGGPAGHRVRHPEDGAGVVGCEVTGAGEVTGRESSVEEHPEGDESDGEGGAALGRGGEEGEGQHGEGRTHHADGVEDSPHSHHGPGLLLQQIVGNGRVDQSSEISGQHRQSGENAVLLDADSEHLLEVERAVGAERDDADTVAGVCDDEAEEGDGGEYGEPGNWSGLVTDGSSQLAGDILQLCLGYPRVVLGAVEHEELPGEGPEEGEAADGVEGRLPAEAVDDDTAERIGDDETED